MKESMPQPARPELPKDTLEKISSYFGLGELVVKEKIGEGVLNQNYRVIATDSGISYFLRGHRQTDNGMVETFYKAEQFFAQNNIPVVQAMAVDDKSVVETQNGIYTLYPWVEGRRPAELKDHNKALKSVARL